MKMCSDITNIPPPGPLLKEKLGILGIEISIGIVYTISGTVARKKSHRYEHLPLQGL